MSTVTNLFDPSLPQESPLSAESAVRDQVWSLLSGLYPAHRNGERRAEQRFPYPYLVQLTPVAANGTPMPEETVVVAGKHLSERGLGFYHPFPLPFRRMVASLQGHDQAMAHFYIDITWCRFTGQGWYDSGGKFLRAVTDPRRPIADRHVDASPQQLRSRTGRVSGDTTRGNTVGGDIAR